MPEEPREEAIRLRERIQQAAGQCLGDPRAVWVLGTSDAGPPAGVTGPAALVYHPEYGHTDLHNHPESKERVQAILDFLEAPDPVSGRVRQESLFYVSPYDPPGWQEQELLRKVHGESWVRRVQELSSQLAAEENSDIVLESDLEFRAGSYEGAVLAVRGAACAVDLVISRPSVRLAVALVRPPGHLAGNKICIFNNIAIGAVYGQQLLSAKNGGRKPHVLIVDCDAHHGKNTQDVFYQDKNTGDQLYQNQDGSVVYFSTHQAGVHPGTGSFAERGRGAGAGCMVNVPVPPMSGDRVYAEVLHRILVPILSGFRPELILVSLGFDAYRADDFSQLNLGDRSYGELAAVLRHYCQQHPTAGVAASLEGGYDLDSMGRCLWKFVSTFCELAPPGEYGPAEDAGTSWLNRYLLEQDSGVLDSPILDSEHQRWYKAFLKLETDVRNKWGATETIGQKD